MNIDTQFVKMYKTKDHIILSICDSILETCPEYDFFDITLTPEFCAIENLVSMLVERAVGGTLERGAYSKYCEHCESGEI